MPQLMGIGPIGTSNNVIFKRKFRWTFEVQDVCAGGNNLGNIPSSYVKLAARPNISFDETEINFLQGKMFIPGKATFETVTSHLSRATQSLTFTTGLVQFMTSLVNQLLVIIKLVAGLTQECPATATVLVVMVALAS